jgi:NitT/TauT family transport system substrate-binding protein
MKHIDKLAYCLMATVSAVVLASCSSGSSSGISSSMMAASGPPPEQPSIVVDAVPTADEAGLYIAQDNGYFAQQGLNVKIVSVNGGELGLPDLQDGKAQLLAGNYVSFIQAQINHAAEIYVNNRPVGTKPINLRIVAEGSVMQAGNQALYVMPNSRIKTVSDLVKYHASVGVNTPNNIGQVLLGSLFQGNGLSLGDINQVFQPFPTLVTMLAKGQINAAWLPEPFATIAKEQLGAVQLADFDQGSLQNFPIGCYIGSAQWVQTHPNTVAAFLRALQKGQQVADSNRAAVEQGLEKNTQPATPTLFADVMTLDTYPLTMDVPRMQRVANAMLEFGIIKKPYNISNMIQPEPGMVDP